MMIVAVVAVVIWAVMMVANMGFMVGVLLLVGARGGGAPYINSLHHVTQMGQRGVNIYLWAYC